MPPLPTILLTGFLGSGKTTLLLRWLRESPATGRRLGVVMNEFGAESVDSELIQRPGLPLQQVTGGCLCCASDQELPNAVTRMIRADACDFLVVETSGLAEPDDVIDVLTDYDLLPQISLQAVVTLVDAPWYASPGDSPGERVLARKQIQFAQVIGLSKCDRISSDASDWVAAEMRALNPRAQIIKLPFGLPDLGELLGGPGLHASLTSVEADALESGVAPKPLHLHSGYRSLTWRFPAPVDRSQFEGFLSQLDPREVIRAKGFVRFKHQPEKLQVFQTVWGHHLIDEFPRQPPPDAVAVLIGPNLEPAKYRRRLQSLIYGGPTFELAHD